MNFVRSRPITTGSVLLGLVARALLVLSIFFIFGEKARAEVGLVQYCLSGESVNTVCEPRAWARPTPSMAVAWCAAGLVCSWTGNTAFTRWETIPADGQVHVCPLDIPIGPIATSRCLDNGQNQATWISKAQVLAAPGFIGGTTLTWVHPTQNDDDTPLPLVQIANTGIYYSRTCTLEALLTSTTMQIVPAPARLTIVENLADGQWCFGARTVDTAGRISALSKIVMTTIQPVPNAPIELSVPPPGLVTSEATVYTSLKATDRTTMVPVGTASLGTPCIQSEATLAQGVTYFAVPRVMITWAGSVEPANAWGRCSAE
jgi:hypothetical protein